MLKTGEKQELTVVKEVSFGVYLAEAPDSRDKVLLPKKETDGALHCGDRLTVFLYRDSSDRLIATKREPMRRIFCCPFTSRLQRFMQAMNALSPCISTRVHGFAPQ